jgi:hypothetical protein
MAPRREEEEEEDEAPVERRSKANRKEKRKVKVLEDAGLSEAERRVVRQKQRSLASQLDQSTTLEDLQKARNSNNVLFDKVAYTREAVLDAENVNVLVKKYAAHVERMCEVRKSKGISSSCRSIIVSYAYISHIAPSSRRLLATTV